MGTSQVATITGISSTNILRLILIVTIAVNTEQAINIKQDVGPVSLPTTSSEFSCMNRTLGSYYPDYQSNCQMFHLCATGEEGEVLNLSFLCPEGAAFDDRATDCLPVESVDCNATVDTAESTSVRSTRRAQIQQLKDSSSTSNSNYKTTFKCRGKKLGRYYADPETGCRLFHLCTPGSTKTELLDFQFLCLAGTLFDENMQRCTEDVKNTCGGDKALKKQTPTAVKPEIVSIVNGTTPEAAEDSQTEFGMDGSDTLRDPLRKKRSEPLKVERILKMRSDAKRRSKRALPPSFDLENLPLTSFTCVGKVPGGYYADIEAGCQLYHVCSQGPDGRVQNFKFLCINGTIFSQQTRTCQTWYTVDCDSTMQFVSLNDDLSRVTDDPLIGTLGISQPLSPQISQSSVQRTRPQIQQQRPLQQIQPQFHVEDNLEFLQSIPQEQQQQQQFVEPVSPSPPQFHGRFQAITEPQQIVSASATQANTVPTSTEGRKRGRGGRRRRPKTRKRVQQAAGSSLQQPTTPVHRTSTPSSVTPSISVVDDGRVGFQDHTSDLLELDVHGQFAQGVVHDVQRTTSVQRPQLRQQVTVQQSRQQAQQQLEVAQSPRRQQLVAIQTSRQQPSRQQSSPVESFPSGSVAGSPQQNTGDVFTGFDAFISAAIEDEQRQRQQFKILQEQRRLRGELEPVEEQIQVATRAPVRPVSRRRRPTVSTDTPPITTAVPTGVPQVPFNTNTFQGIGADIPVATRAPPPAIPFRTDVFETPSITQQSTQPISEFPSTDSVLPSGLPQLHEIPLFDSTPGRPAHRKPARRPQFQQISVAQPSVNLDNIFMQQLSQRPQPRTPSHVAPQQNINLDALLLQQLSSRPTLAQTTPSLPLQTPTWHNMNLNNILMQQASRPTFAQIPVAGGAHMNNLLLQPMPTRPQPPTLSTIPDVFFLVPSESQLSAAQLGRFGFQLRQRRAVPQTSTPPSQFLDSDVPRLIPRQRHTHVPPLFPITSFSCKGKVMGGYYADVETGCKMFHICSTGRSRSLLSDFRFLCANETLFDQRSQTCSRPEKVKCDISPAYYPKHPLPEESFDFPVPNSELLRIRSKRALPAGVVKVSPGEIPQTSFSCLGRENGRYYADAETNCQLFHLCAEVSPGGWLQEHPFLCPNGTVFDQRAQACDDQTDALNCIEDPLHYGIDEIFARTRH